MIQLSRIRPANALAATAVAAVLLAAGCSSGDPIGIEDDKTADTKLDGDLADITLTPESPLNAQQLAATADIVRKRATAIELPVKTVTVGDGTLVVRASRTKFGADTKQRVAGAARRGQLTLRPVTSATPVGVPAVPAPPGSAPPSDGSAAAECGGPNQPRVDTPTEPLTACDVKRQEKLVLAPAVMTGADVDTATVAKPDGTTTSWQINLKWTAQGQDAFTKLTARASGGELPTNRVAIVSDGVVLTAPSVMSVIPGNAVITGEYTQDAARELAAIIDAGALPTGFTVSAVVDVP
ncbi:SecDF P1 head subdomain-containing protein [Embleya sp. NBC_00896]|uniref:SecDF P1 head subdomain-containing protein n=1 Tax=Embleya sp. NBC_00896 TaxID=2975961 RepID=UPI002F917C57|nr:hypothetical protein OG928_38840 [Embleya sp. NBC_00896]